MTYRKVIIYLVIVISFINISKISYSQNEVIQFEHLSVEEGLSQNHVIRILKDSKGFMWFCTQNGLNRYDGKDFKIYKHNPADSNSLSNNHVQAIYEDNNGNLWIGTYGGGLDKYELATEKFTHYRFDPIKNSISNDRVLSIYEDKSGYLWIGTDNGGVNQFDRKKNTWIQYQNIPDNPNSLSSNVVRALYEDNSGILWIGTDGGGLNKFNRKTGKFTCYKHNPDNPNSLSQNFVLAIIEDENGALWLATYGGGLEKFDKNTETFKHYKHDPKNINSLAQNVLQDMVQSPSEPGVIWIATSSSGVDKFEIQKEKFTHFKHDPYDPSSLSTNKTFTIYEDLKGLVWVGTAGKGVSKYSSTMGKIIHYKKEYNNPHSLNSNSILSIYEDDSEIVWIGTSEGGLNVLDRQKGKLRHYKYDPDNLNSLINNTIYDIKAEKPGILWIGTFGGLSRFDTRTNQFLNFKNDPKDPHSLSNNYVNPLYIDRSNNLWIGTLSGGLNKLELSDVENNPIFIHYLNVPDDSTSICENSITEIYEDRNGFLWVGSSSNGLDKFDIKAENFIHYQHDPDNPKSISKNFITTIYQDKKGTLWVGTFGGGLNKFNPDNQTFTHFEEKDGLCNNFVCGILEDDHHNLWISTRNGLSKFNPSLVNKKGIVLSSAFKNYYVDDGFQDNVFIQNSYFKNSNGEMFFGGINGFNIFHPDSLIENHNIPNIILTEFSVLNKTFRLDSSITTVTKIVLPHNKNFFSFHFAALDFTNPRKNQYAYKLEGLDEDWIYSGNFNFASYTDVNPGKYTFRVKGSNNDGVWNEAGTSLKIIILPPWWETWWAYTIYGCIVFCLLYGTRRYELNRQNLKHNWELKRVEAEKYQEIDRVKSRFFANISHEFRTPLTLIKGPIQQMMSGDFKGNIKKQYQIVLRNTDRLMQLINQLLDLSKLDSGQMLLRTSPENIVPLVNGLIQSFETLAKQKNIVLQFQSSGDEVIVYIDRDKFEKIIINLLSNAFKFTPEGENVSVNINIPKTKIPDKSHPPKGSSLTYLEILVHNTGPGIFSEKLDKIFDRFYQVDDSSVRKYEGTGIGLALTKDLVELHHGKITVESEPGNVTTFKVYLPLGKNHLQPEEIIETPSEILTDIKIDSDLVELSHSNESKTEAAFQPVNNSSTLLIVEDNSDMRNYLRESLKSNYKIIDAVNGEEGIQQSLKHSPDIIISDVMMPKMDGFQFCAEIKKDKRTSHIPVILLTAKASGESKIEGLETGADDYLTKPFDTRELKVRIKNLIQQRRRLQEKFRKEINVNPRDITVTSIDERLVQKAIDVVEKNISDPNFDIAKMAKEVGISRRLLHTKLKVLTGQSTGEFIRTLRLKRAAQLLQQGYGNVTQVSYEVGFQSLSYFAKAFREQFDQSPSQYSSQGLGKDPR